LEESRKRVLPHGSGIAANSVPGFSSPEASASLVGAARGGRAAKLGWFALANGATSAKRGARGIIELAFGWLANVSAVDKDRAANLNG
jgi:hypothetical protein